MTSVLADSQIAQTRSRKTTKNHTTDYQIDIIDQVNQLDHPLIPLPTGGGKTVIAAAIIKQAVAARLYVIFVVHRRELVIQARRMSATRPGWCSSSSTFCISTATTSAPDR